MDKMDGMNTDCLGGRWLGGHVPSAQQEVHILAHGSRSQLFELRLGRGSIDVGFNGDDGANQAEVVDDARFMVPQNQLDRVVGVKDQVGPLHLIGEGFGNEFRCLKPYGIRPPQRPAFQRALAQLEANVVVRSGLRTDQRDAEEKAASPDIGPLRRELERSKAHMGTVNPAKR